MLTRLWNKNTHPLLVGVKICTAIMEISLLVSHEDENESTSRPSYSTFGHIPKGLFILPEGHFLYHVHFCSIHTFQILERA